MEVWLLQGGFSEIHFQPLGMRYTAICAFKHHSRILGSGTEARFDLAGQLGVVFSCLYRMIGISTALQVFALRADAN